MTISRQHVTKGPDLWAQLAAPVDPASIAWRQDGRAVQRDGKFFARFVCYIEANTVRERLDSVVPGEWDLTLTELPALPNEEEPLCSFKARLQILGVIREDVGTGKDYKQAATDAFKRAATRFGIGHELYDFDQNWVQVDGDGKYAKPLEDPGEAYARRQSRKGSQGGDDTQAATVKPNAAPTPAAPARASSSVASPTGEPTPALAYPPGNSIDDRAPLDSEPISDEERTLQSDEPTCPKCGGRMWDNRLSKRNPKAPDFKCRNRACDGVIWPARGGAPKRSANLALTDTDDDLPF